MQPVSIYPWTTHLTPEELNELLDSSVLVNYDKNDVIIKQGSLASQILALEQGMVKLNFRESQKDTTFGFSTQGDFIGLMCSFVKKKLEFSAIAITPCQVRVFNRDLFEDLIGRNGAFAIYMVTMMSELINVAVHKLITLSHRNAGGALATFLLNLVKVFGSEQMVLPFTREEIANTLGYSRESIINTLQEFQRDGFISISGKNLEVLNRSALGSIAEKG
ncbi:MAG: Crp/Fnr family transcriptional regulator [Bacteroidales bacterium]|nr:Crp/Fnr family transcriptional regulator [Bacteroidales bacterium]